MECFIVRHTQCLEMLRNALLQAYSLDCTILGMNESVCVLLSGGQDSATCLAIALDRHQKVEALGFDYGQRHRIELKQAAILAQTAGVPFRVINLGFIQSLHKNALTHPDMPIETAPNTLPNTFVPGRNAFFLTTAAAFAYSHQIQTLYTGVCQTDYSGYPDCRAEFIQSMTQSLSLAMDTSFEIQTPLMWKTKAETVLWMKTLGKLDWYQHTHTCYLGKRPACGTCPACELRLKGFRDADIADPLAYAPPNIP